jgi:single-strand DNA-binding protein
MSAPTVTVVGRLTADPELRFTPSGAAVVNFTIAANDSYKKNDEWVDKDAVFLRCNVWREAAENIAESLVRGTEVIAQGKLAQRSFETREGDKRTVIELEVSAIGPTLTKQTAKVSKSGERAAAGRAPSSDPWGGSDDEPPF